METKPLAEQEGKMTKTDTDEAVFVGVDVAKDRFDFAARPSGETGHGGVNAAGLADLAERIKRLNPQVIAMEASGRLRGAGRGCVGRGGPNRGGGERTANPRFARSMGILRERAAAKRRARVAALPA